VPKVAAQVKVLRASFYSLVVILKQGELAT